ncbi:FecR domain-containing protein [Flavobacteriaceae bacterium AH-315-B10]|nr:FecR domain-containing protein [Flavobacteriaceae bacterium AH-315-B10]
MNKEDLLIKWMDGELTDGELSLFQQQPEYASYEKLYKNATYFKSPKVNKEEQFDNFKLRLKKENNFTAKYITPYNFLLRIAAIFVIGFGLYFTLINEDLTKVNTLVSESTNIILPDYSQVTINAASLIKYNDDNWSEKRNLSLEGEAFFKVSKGSVFVVKTKLGNITVLGTQFNVKQRGKLLEVQCYEGLVNVEISKTNIKLKAGETIRFINNKLIEGKTSLTKPSWIDGKSSFKSIPFYEVLAEFERQFGVSIVLDNFDNKKLFTGSFVNDNKELALKSITQPFKLSYDLNSENIKIFEDE